MDVLTSQRYDLAKALLQQTLPSNKIGQPVSKKQRTEHQENSIGARLELEFYNTVSALADDLQLAVNNLKEENSGIAHADIEKVERTIARYAARSSAAPRSPKAAAAPSAGQVLTVRSNVEGGGVRQLFSGLRVTSSADRDLGEIDLRKLPNGFDITEATILDAHQLTTSRDARTFGDVFAQQKNIRPLEKPMPTTGTQSMKLVFQQPFENALTRNKDDYRAAHVTAGTWLTYPASETDFDVRPGMKPKTNDFDSLFNVVFSSFAPSEDNTMAIIPRSDRARLWYMRHGTRSLGRIIPQSSHFNAFSTSDYPQIGDDFQDVIDRFEPVSVEDAQGSSGECCKGNSDVLEEIMELLQTLASQQRIRLQNYQDNVDRVIPDKPDHAENDVFELLRKQLQILVASLPPFAIAKLDGEQLKELNISTALIMHVPDVAGTAQPDEGTLQKQRLAVAQQATLKRPSPAPVRNSYNAPTPAQSYNSQVRNYVATTTQTPSMPGYAQRNAQSYSTPRPNAVANYQPQAYGRTQQPYPGATIQQYQRLQNGISQTASPAKPVTNGQPYPQRPTAAQLLQNLGSNDANATVQQMKAAQQQSIGTHTSQPSYNANAQLQRQASGTPQPQGHPYMQVRQPANTATAAPGQLNGLALQRASATPQPSTGIAQA